MGFKPLWGWLLSWVLWYQGVFAHRRGVLVATCALEVEHLPGCESWPPAWGRRTFSLPVPGAPSFMLEGWRGEGVRKGGKHFHGWFGSWPLPAWLDGVWLWGWWIREGTSLGLAKDGMFQKPVISAGHALWGLRGQGRGWRDRRCGLYPGCEACPQEADGPAPPGQKPELLICLPFALG